MLIEQIIAFELGRPRPPAHIRTPYNWLNS